MQKDFSYKAELRKARESSNARVGNFINENPTIGYREVARRFQISPALISAIARKYCRKRKRGPTPRRTSHIFFIRYRTSQGERDQHLTVTAPKRTPISAISAAISDYFDCVELKENRSGNTDIQAEYSLEELRKLAAIQGQAK